MAAGHGYGRGSRADRCRGSLAYRVGNSFCGQSHGKSTTQSQPLMPPPPTVKSSYFFGPNNPQAGTARLMRHSCSNVVHGRSKQTMMNLGDELVALHSMPCNTDTADQSLTDSSRFRLMLSRDTAARCSGKSRMLRVASCSMGRDAFDPTSWRTPKGPCVLGTQISGSGADRLHCA